MGDGGGGEWAGKREQDLGKGEIGWVREGREGGRVNFAWLWIDWIDVERIYTYRIYTYSIYTYTYIDKDRDR